MTKLDNILKLYQEIEDKKDFLSLASDEFKLKAISINNNWFNGFYNIPETKQDQLITFLQNYIKHQPKPETAVAS